MKLDKYLSSQLSRLLLDRNLINSLNYPPDHRIAQPQHCQTLTGPRFEFEPVPRYTIAGLAGGTAHGLPLVGLVRYIPSVCLALGESYISSDGWPYIFHLLREFQSLSCSKQEFRPWSLFTSMNQHRSTREPSMAICHSTSLF